MSKITPNTVALGLYPLKSLPRGEYIRRVDVCKTCKGESRKLDWSCVMCEGKGYTQFHKTIYIKGDYSRSWPNAGKYSLTDFEDTNREIYQRGSVLVLAGFTF